MLRIYNVFISDVFNYILYVNQLIFLFLKQIQLMIYKEQFMQFTYIYTMYLIEQYYRDRCQLMVYIYVNQQLDFTNSMDNQTNTVQVYTYCCCIMTGIDRFSGQGRKDRPLMPMLAIRPLECLLHLAWGNKPFGLC